MAPQISTWVTRLSDSGGHLTKLIFAWGHICLGGEVGVGGWWSASGKYHSCKMGPRQISSWNLILSDSDRVAIRF